MNNQAKLIDVDKERLVQKLREYARQFVTPQLCKDLSDAANIIEVLISPPVPTIKPGDTRDAEKILDGVLRELDTLKLYDINPKAFKRISDIINGGVVE